MANILVIEDNPPNRELMLYLLDAFGHMPLEAVDGETGLQIASLARPDLILCDIQLPGLDGYALARRFKSEAGLPATPLVAVTAYAMVGDRERLLAAGFDGYIAKPINPETFVPEVEAYLRPGPRLARGPTPAEAPTEPIILPTAPGHASILVVDDFPSNLYLLRSILEPSGYTVHTADRVSEALTQARAAPPDLILSDLHMADESGFDLLRAVKADPDLRHIAVAIHSATIASPGDQARALALGAVRVITRPIEPKLLLQEIEACLVRSP